MTARLATAAAIPFLALGLQWFLWPWISPFVWFLFFPAVFLSARIGGFSGGMISTMLSALIVWAVFVPRVAPAVETPTNLWSVALFLIMGFLFSESQNRLERANRRTRVALEETRAANAEITRLYQKARELDELKTQFFANISHELRTPLNLIMGPVAKHLSGERLDSELRHDLEVVERNALLLNRHIADLLDAARTGAGHMPVRYVQTDLAHLIRLVCSCFELVAADRGITLRIDAPQCLSAQVDEEKVRRILFNLLSNAFKFTPDGGRIGVALSVAGGKAVIEVHDSGPGVPESLREVIFEPFRQGDGGVGRRFGGTGLGLAIVRQFAELHRGVVWVADDRAGGARFILELPVAAPPGSPVADTADAGDSERDRQVVAELRRPDTGGGGRSAPVAPGTDPPPLILLVEDNPDMNAFLAEALGVKYRVSSAFDGRQGLDLALALSPDLIVADVMMPGLGGDEMILALRRHSELAGVPIVVVSARADDRLRVRLLEAGVQDYLTKPVAVDELRARVDGLLAERARTTRLLRAGTARSQSNFEQASVGMAELALDGRCQKVNHTLCTILGYDASDLVGRTLAEIAGPDADRMVEGAIETGTLETCWRRKDGAEVWISLTVALAPGLDGAPDHLIAVVVDIQARKDAEIALAQLQATVVQSEIRARVAAFELMEEAVAARIQAEKAFAALREGEERLRLVFKATQDGLWDWDLRSGRCVLSPRYWEIVGYTPGEVDTDLGFLKRLLHPDDRALVLATLEESIRGDSDESTIECRMIRRDGGVRWIQARGQVVERDTSGRALRMLGAITDITARKEAEIALRRSGERAQAVIAAAPVAMFLVDDTGVIQQANATAEAIFGYGPGDMTALAVEELLPEALRPGHRPRPDAFHEGPDPRAMRGHELTGLRKNGEKFPVELGLGVVQLGTQAMVVVSLLDITDRKQAEAAQRDSEERLKHSEERLQLAIRGANDGIWDWDLRTNALYLSPQWKRMIGYQDDELANAFVSFADQLHPDDRPAVLALVDRYRTGAQDRHTQEFRLRHKDGTWRWIFSRGEALRDAAGSAYRVAGSHTDITDRKHSEQQIQDLVERLTLATRAAGVGIWDLDLIRGSLVWNEEMFRIYGVSPAVFPEAGADWMWRVHPDDRAAVQAEHHLALTGEKDLRTEFRIVRPDGAVRSVAARAIVHRASDGRPHGRAATRMLGTIWDVTDHQTVLANLKAAKEQAEAASIAKGRFLANMSHELRTPLNAILGFANLLDSTETDPTRLDYLAMISEAGNSLLNLIQDILDLSRIEAGRVRVAQEPFDVRHELAAVLRFFQAQTEKKGLHLGLEIDPAVPAVVRGDPGLLRQVLLNLVGNAVKFTDRGGVTVTVAHQEPAPARVVLTFAVSDTGIGISPENQERIFRIFEQEDDILARRYGGAGLGLAICKDIVTLMNGRIWVESMRGRGARFTFTAAFDGAEVTLRAADRAGREERSRLGTHRPASILIVDDDAFGRKLCHDILVGSGYGVMCADDGAKAIAILSDAAENQPPNQPPRPSRGTAVPPRFDLVLMDIQMPGMDGITVTDQIRAGKIAGCDPAIPVIAVTAHALRGDRDRFLAHGMTDYVAKPIDPAKLLATIDACLS